MKKKLLLMGLLGSFAVADMLGGEINLGYYSHSPSGTAQYDGDLIDIEDDLKWGDEGDIFIKAYLEHPLPLLPNIKLGYSSFGHSGSGKLRKNLQFAGEVFTVNSDVDSTLDLKMYDITLYYELLDNWINIDAGINVKYIDGNLKIHGTNIATQQVINESKNFQVPIPMLYGKARFDVPTTDLSLQIEANYVTYDGNTLYDAEAGVRYTLTLGVGLEAGYRTMKLKLDDVDDFSMDTDFSGAYGKLVWDF